MSSIFRPAGWGLLLAALCVPLEARAAGPFSKTLADMGLELKNAPAYELQTDRHWGIWPQADAQWTVTTASATPKLRLKAYSEFSPTDASSKEKLQLDRTLFLYVGDTAYPGMKAHPTNPAPPELLPTILPRSPTGHQGALLSATDGLTYGNLLPALAVYRGILTFLYCPSTRRFFQIEIFYPRAGFKAEAALRDAGRFSCAP